MFDIKEKGKVKVRLWADAEYDYDWRKKQKQILKEIKKYFPNEKAIAISDFDKREGMKSYSL